MASDSIPFQGRKALKRSLILITSLLFIFSLASCTKKISGKAAPSSEMYKHYCFSIQSPGEEWKRDEEISKFLFYPYAYKITFFLQPSKTHSKIAFIEERKRFGSYDSPDAFYKFAASTFIERYQSSRYEMIKQNFYPDKECGEYCLVHYLKFKDKEAPNRGNAEFLICEGLEYYFILPENNDYIIYASYSERGKPGELINVVRSADNFFSGLALLKCN